MVPPIVVDFRAGLLIAIEKLNFDVYDAGKYLAEPKSQRRSCGRLPASHAEFCLHVGMTFSGIFLDGHFAGGESARCRAVKYNHLSDPTLQRVEGRGLLLLIGVRYSRVFEPHDAVCRRFQFDRAVLAIDGDVQLRTAVLMGVLNVFVWRRGLGGRRAGSGGQENGAND